MDSNPTPLQQFVQAVMNKDYTAVDMQLAKYPSLSLAKLDSIDTTGSYPVGQTIMNVIGSMGDVPMAKIVMKHMRTHLNVTADQSIEDIDSRLADNDGNRPMHWAAMSGKLDMVKYLHEEEGASLLPNNIVRTTPLSDAAGYGHTETVNYIVSRTSPDALLQKNIYELDAYTRASYLARPETLEAIIGHIKQSAKGEAKLQEIAGEGFNARDMAESVRGTLSKEKWFSEVEGKFDAVRSVLDKAGVKPSEKWNNLSAEEKATTKTFDHAGRWIKFQAERCIR